MNSEYQTPPPPQSRPSCIRLLKLTFLLKQIEAKNSSVINVRPFLPVTVVATFRFHTIEKNIAFRGYTKPVVVQQITNILYENGVLFDFCAF